MVAGGRRAWLSKSGEPNIVSSNGNVKILSKNSKSTRCWMHRPCVGKKQHVFGNHSEPCVGKKQHVLGNHSESCVGKKQHVFGEHSDQEAGNR